MTISGKLAKGSWASGKRSGSCLVFALMSCTGVLYPDEIPVIDDLYNIQHWRVDDGLPRNTITSITQGPDGFIWLGSFFSLIRFDGIEFKEYGLESATPSLNVRHLTSDNSGDIYVAPRNQSLQKFSKNRFSEPSIDNGDSYHDFHCVTTGPDNTVWAIDGDGVIYKVVGDELVKMTILEREFQHDILFEMAVAENGTIWFSRGEFYGCYKPGGESKIWRRANGAVKLSIAGDGSIWMLTKEELRKLVSEESGDTELVVTLPVERTWINDLFVDSRGRVWMGVSGHGLFLWENNKLKRFQSVPKNFWYIFEDRDGSIWIGLEGNGLLRINEKIFQVINAPDSATDSVVRSVHKSLFVPASPGVYPLEEKFFSDSIEAASKLTLSTVWVESDDSFWAGSHTGRLFHFNQGKVEEYQIESREQPVRLLFMDSKRNIWAGGFDFGLSKLSYPYETVERLFSEIGNRQNIMALAELPTGEIFAGSRAGNIFCFEKGSVRIYNPASGLKGSSILSLLYVSTGHLLAGTSGHGLAVLDGDQFHHISTEHGLHDSVISQMVEDGLGHLWIGSTRGIFRIALSDLEDWLKGRTKRVPSVAFGKLYGLSNLEAISEFQPGASLTSDGIIEFATNKGVIRVNPEKFGAASNPIRAVIDSIQIDDLQMSGDDPVRIRSGFQRISFNYSAAGFASPQSIQYRCSLAGFDDGWIPMGKERSIHYARLPPGDYIFKISASDQNGNWPGEFASIPLFVVPRWWETLLARVLFLVLFTACVGFIVRMIIVRRMQMTLERARQEMLLERERTRISKDLHDDLGARLTEVAFMADLALNNSSSPATKHSAWDSIAKQVRMASASLDETVWMIDPASDILDEFVHYLVQYTTEFCERSNLTCRLDIPNTLPLVKLEGRTQHNLFLAFKEALTNVVRHSGATLVKVAVSCDSRQLRVSVTDNGKGLNLEEAEAGQRHGISNMRDRMDQIGGGLDFKSSPENGTVIIFTFNL